MNISLHLLSHWTFLCTDWMTHLDILGKYLLFPCSRGCTVFNVICPNSHSHRCNKSLNPPFQQKLFEVHWSTVTKSTKKEKKNTPKTNLSWQAIIYSAAKKQDSNILRMSHTHAYEASQTHMYMCFPQQRTINNLRLTRWSKVETFSVEHVPSCASVHEEVSWLV